MTRDDIVQWTRQAGGFDATPEFLERFAALVAAAEREACAVLCNTVGEDMTIMAQWGADECAAAIRARGETK